ncbi:MAG: DNA/RNA helicase domain-containing protein [Planctomycetota bacterium]
MTRRPYALAASVGEFLEASPARLVGELSAHLAALSPFGNQTGQQTLAWQQSLDWLKAALREVVQARPIAAQWGVCLEYEIPRRGGRIDAILIAPDTIVVLEFKSSQADASAIRQAEDYALELRDFHSECRTVPIAPVVCAGNADYSVGEPVPGDTVAHVSLTRPADLSRALLEVIPAESATETSWLAWIKGTYAPTPTIVEAARALYSGHGVRELGLSGASAQQLKRTEDVLRQAVHIANEENAHVACFVTGVPGAGKTLAGLNVVHALEGELAATFLSGNGPLVSVLQEVLAHDLKQRDGGTLADARRKAKTLVTNVHRWIDHGLQEPSRPPHESIVVFDEAQRAWDREQSKRKFGREASEPEQMLQILSRRRPAVLVALVGGGQEINAGESGLSEWGRALAQRFPDWRILASPGVVKGDLPVGTSLFPDDLVEHAARVHEDEDLHLAVSQRSFRSEHVTEWVESVLRGDADGASRAMEHLTRYPIVLARDLDVAKAWVRERARGSRRTGLLASSGARRLRPHGITVQVLTVT